MSAKINSTYPRAVRLIASLALLGFFGALAVIAAMLLAAWSAANPIWDDARAEISLGMLGLLLIYECLAFISYNLRDGTLEHPVGLYISAVLFVAAFVVSGTGLGAVLATGFAAHRAWNATKEMVRDN